ncbi:laccase-like multicopper oxidase [Periconia macrospinosa]|uniref:Laccase-like multicopper oxidase n=1 Tax=Periconia macrospinosa TaxID=97972 RepID=A0A2V1DWK0_9PLEO|nr:laccase-like multicopper oxidase [Periconia macrospinosa]
MQWYNCLLLLPATLASLLPCDSTNGGSLLGTLDAKPLTLHRQREPPQTRHFTFELTRKTLNPDGVTREFLVVNGEYPGPTIEANLGDTISVTVINNIDSPKEGTSIHWHGLPQRDTKWADGVPSLTQCPIAAGSNFTYTFKAEVAGTTWWHAHFTAQYTDGLFGGLIIHGSQYAEQYDIDLGPIHLHDTYHIDYVSYLLPVYNIPPVFIPVDTNLINGRGPFNCSLDTHGSNCKPNSTEPAKFRFQPGKKHLLRLINTGGATIQHFSIDDHELTVIANDFTPVQPYKTNVATLGIGQRTDVIVEAKGKEGDAVWMRSEIDQPCVNGTVWQPNATAIVYYTNADETRIPNTKRHDWKTDGCLNDPLDIAQPIKKRSVPTPDLVEQIDIRGGKNASGNLVYFVNGSQFRANFSSTPLLQAASNGITEYPDHPEYNIYNFGDAKNVRIVVYNHFPNPHTMHLHGHEEFWILATGMGEWDGTITQEANPQRRDSAQMRAAWGPDQPSHLVIQFVADNPGVWSLHCHFIIHISAGLYMSFIEQPEQIKEGAYEDVMHQTEVPELDIPR